MSQKYCTLFQEYFKVREHIMLMDAGSGMTWWQIPFFQEPITVTMTDALTPNKVYWILPTTWPPEIRKSDYWESEKEALEMAPPTFTWHSKKYFRSNLLFKIFCDFRRFYSQACCFKEQITRLNQNLLQMIEIFKNLGDINQSNLVYVPN